MILELGQLREIVWPPAPFPQKEAASDKLSDLPKALQQVREDLRLPTSAISHQQPQGMRIPVTQNI